MYIHIQTIKRCVNSLHRRLDKESLRDVLFLRSSPLASQLGEVPAPLYARVKQMIVSQIQSGAWPPHHRVPSESELVSQLGFSRMTINRALRELTSDGLLVRMQG